MLQINIKCFYSFALSGGKKDYTDYQLSPREINYSETRNFSNTPTCAHSRQNSVEKFVLHKEAMQRRKNTWWVKYLELLMYE